MKTPEERAAWLAERRNFVTASDVAAVMGLSPHKSRKNVYKDKVYGSTNDIDRLPMVMAGKYNESGILAWHLAHRNFEGYGWESGDDRRDMLPAIDRVTSSGLVLHPESRVLAATPDAIVWSEPSRLWVTEIKNVDKDKAFTDWVKPWHRWESTTAPDNTVLHAMPYQKIDKGSLAAPAYYWVQLQAQMACLNIIQGRIVVQFGGNARADLDYHLDVPFISRMLKELDEFWREVLTARELHDE